MKSYIKYFFIFFILIFLNSCNKIFQEIESSSFIGPLPAPNLALASDTKSPSSNSTPSFFIMITTSKAGEAFLFRSADCTGESVSKKFLASRVDTKLSLTSRELSEGIHVFSAGFRQGNSVNDLHTHCSASLSYTYTSASPTSSPSSATTPTKAPPPPAATTPTQAPTSPPKATALLAPILSITSGLTSPSSATTPTKAPPPPVATTPTQAPTSPPKATALLAPILSITPGLTSPSHVSPGFFLTTTNQGTGKVVFYRSADCTDEHIFEKSFKYSSGTIVPKGTKLPLTFFISKGMNQENMFSAKVQRGTTWTPCSNNISYIQTPSIRRLPDKILLNGGVDMKISDYFTVPYLSKDNNGYNIFERMMKIWNEGSTYYTFFKVSSPSNEIISNLPKHIDGTWGIYATTDKAGFDIVETADLFNLPSGKHVLAITQSAVQRLNIGESTEYIEIIEADIIFDYRYSEIVLNRSNKESTKFEVTLLHELGHAIGLDHAPDNIPSIMLPLILAKPVVLPPLALSKYDIQTINEIYEAPNRVPSKSFSKKRISKGHSFKVRKTTPLNTSGLPSHPQEGEIVYQTIRLQSNGDCFHYEDNKFMYQHRNHTLLKKLKK